MKNFIIVAIGTAVGILVFAFLMSVQSKRPEASPPPAPAQAQIPAQSAAKYLCPKHGEVEEVLIFNFAEEPGPLAFCIRCLRDGLRTVIAPIGPKVEK